MSTYTVLVTGANSGLGFSTCCRLMDEFLSTRPASQRLHLLFVTRSTAKSADTHTRLLAHLNRTLAAVYGTEPKGESIRRMQRARVTLEGELADLCELASVKRLGRRLVGRGQRLDVLICNAGMSGWEGLRWGEAIVGFCTDIFEAATFPTFKKGHVGRRAARQGGGGGKEMGDRDISAEDEPVMGETFTANVFGHYMLAHWLVPVMVSEDGVPARVVWVGSIESFDKYLDVEDLQGLTTGFSYESSKRLTELLVLTSETPGTERYVKGFLSPDGRDKVSAGTGGQVRPKMYLSHPGVCVTAISGIHWFLVYFNIAALYLVRWLGSPWHPISSYIAAVSTVWVALAASETLEKLEDSEGKAKWGSATDRMGGERVVRTEVDGWGWGGKGEEPDGIWRVSVRRKVTRSHSREEREEFEAKGAIVWKQMEILRMEWEKRLEDIK